MKLDTLGEFGLIDLIQVPCYTPDNVIIGRGDDCAVLPYDERYYQVSSCDLLVEDVHFIRRLITPQELGYKAVAVNLSDVAAMGGKPLHILLSLALPPDYTVEEWQGFYQGVDAICRKYGVNVIGGDTTSSPDRLTINVTVLGLVEQKYLHLRSHAKPGDVIFATGSLGGSKAGLELFLRKEDSICLTETQKEQLRTCHCRPEPCCEEIAILNQIAGSHLHALNDISDGLLSECREISEASGAALILKPDCVPVQETCMVLAEQLGENGLEWAMTGGEDYQLVGTMKAEKAEEICRLYEQQTGRKLTIIGFVEAGSGVYLLNDGVRNPVEQSGYNHFPAETKQKPAVYVSENNDAVENLLHQRLAELDAREEQQRIYQHDWNNHLACLAGLLECGESDAAMAYLQQMIQTVPKTAHSAYSTRPILNILFSQKARQAEAVGMDVQIVCEDGLLDFMNDYDVTTLFGNLLDNGIEHSGISADAWLYLDVMQDAKGDILIRMQNSCEKMPEIQHGTLTTQKADTDLHGKGILQIQRMIGRYGGTFHWQYDALKQTFITECRFSSDSKKML